MNPIRRLMLELKLLARHVPPSVMARYLAKIALTALDIMQEGTLAPADRAMVGTVTFRMNGKPLEIPLSTIADLLEGYDPTPTFGALREMYASNVYLRAFYPGLRMRRAIDLGANRGLFSLLCVGAYDAEIVVGIEPETHFTSVLYALAKANAINLERLPREQIRISSSDGPDKVTVATVLEKYRLDEVDFLKCDIEGDEFDIFLRDNTFLGSVRNIAMEVHSDAGDFLSIVDALKAYEFDVSTTDQFGAPVRGECPRYLYASRVGELI